MMNPEQLVSGTVSVVCAELSERELMSLYLAVSFDGDPTNTFGYEKAKSLFTERDGTKMHEVTKRAFVNIASQMLG